MQDTRPDEEQILAWCDDGFAESWRCRGVARPLYDKLVDAFMIVSLREDGLFSLLLGDEGFRRLFGTDYGADVEDFSMCVRRIDRACFRDTCAQAVATEERQHLEITWVNAGGGASDSDSGDSLLHTEVTILRVGEHDGNPILLLALQDIDAARKRGRELARSQFASLRALFSEIFLLNLKTGESEGVWLGGRPLVDEEGKDVPVSFHTVFATVHPDDTRLFWKNSNYQYVREKLFGDNPDDALTFDLRRRDDGGDYHWTRMFITRFGIANASETVLVCTQNIDAQMETQRRERELLSRAQFDALTGIYNRGTSEDLMRERLQSLSSDETALFSIIDVDNFKGVNDTWGHQMGDKVLELVAGTLKRSCRDHDIVGRFGGDEFVMLSKGSTMPSESGIQTRFEKCKQQIRDGSAALELDPPVTVSIGVVRIGSGAKAYGSVFDAADRLLYEVKRGGKDGYRYADFEEL